MSSLGRYKYEEVSAFLLEIFDPIAQSYRECREMSTADASRANSLRKRLAILEGQLAWVVYVLGSIVGGRMGVNTSDVHDVIDGQLSTRVFQTVSWMDMHVKHVCKICICM